MFHLLEALAAVIMSSTLGTQALYSWYSWVDSDWLSMFYPPSARKKKYSESNSNDIVL